MAVESVDDQIIDALKQSVIDNEFVADKLDKYTRALLAYQPDDDVSDSEMYWETYSRKLQYYIISMVPDLVREYKYSEIVF